SYHYARRWMSGPSTLLVRSRGMADIPSSFSVPQTARAALRIGNRVSLDSQVNVTPLGLLAIGGLVSAILLSIPPIIRAAGKAARAREKAARRAENSGGDAKA